MYNDNMYKHDYQFCFWNVAFERILLKMAFPQTSQEKGAARPFVDTVGYSTQTSHQLQMLLKPLDDINPITAELAHNRPNA